MTEGQSGREAKFDAFRNKLLEARMLVDAGVPGLYLRSGLFEKIVSAIDSRVSEAGSDHGAEVLHFPALMTREGFERTGYLSSFPDLIGSVQVFSGGDKEHRELLAMAENGEDWSKELTPSELTMCSAACHPLYPTLSSPVSLSGSTYEVFGQVFRHEPSIDPARMQTFRQHEFVYVGNPEGALDHRDLWVERGLEIHGRLQLDIESVVANDPFFGRAGKILAASQKSEALKIELVAPICDEENPTAITSANRHLDHFGESFGIHLEDGSVAHTACVGFGVERITLALLKKHGLDVGSWPEGVRSYLWR